MYINECTNGVRSLIVENLVCPRFFLWFEPQVRKNCREQFFTTEGSPKGEAHGCAEYKFAGSEFTRATKFARSKFERTKCGLEEAEGRTPGVIPTAV